MTVGSGRAKRTVPKKIEKRVEKMPEVYCINDYTKCDGRRCSYNPNFCSEFSKSQTKLIGHLPNGNFLQVVDSETVS